MDSIGMRFSRVPIYIRSGQDTSIHMLLPEHCPWHTDWQRTGTCPVCLSNDSVVPILYGEPSDLGFQQYLQGKLWIGGCVHDEYCEPKWYCKRDEKEF